MTSRNSERNITDILSVHADALHFVETEAGYSTDEDTKIKIPVVVSDLKLLLKTVSQTLGKDDDTSTPSSVE